MSTSQIAANYDTSKFWLYLVVIVCLLLFSGLMSGLTLGLMSLGLVDLEVIKKSGKPSDRIYAEKISPVVQKKHLLLVTLLVGNALAMEALPLFLDSLVNTWGAIALSVTLLLMFGEIIPQAVCSRYGLAVGATMIPIVKFLIYVIFPIAWPVSKLLDYLLGSKHDGLFGRAELKTLVDMHCNEIGNGGELSLHETQIITRVLDLANKTAGYAMTPIAETFCIDVQSRLDDKMLRSIIAKGYSRIPVYASTPNKVVGLILVKELCTVMIDRKTNLQVVTDIRIRRIPRIHEDMPLHDVLHKFNAGGTEMAAIVKSCKDSKQQQMQTGSAMEECKSMESNNCPQLDSTLPQGTKEDPGDVTSIEATPYPNGDRVYQLGHLCPIEEEMEVIGIITREDVLEELLMEKIEDSDDGADYKVTIDRESRVTVDPHPPKEGVPISRQGSLDKAATSPRTPNPSFPLGAESSSNARSGELQGALGDSPVGPPNSRLKTAQERKFKIKGNGLAPIATLTSRLSLLQEPSRTPRTDSGRASPVTRQVAVQRILHT